MKKLHRKTVKRLIAGMLFLGSLVQGAENANMINGNVTELLNIAGKQRMLSQRIAKDYLYIGKKVAVDKASKQLERSLSTFKKSQQYLEKAINDPEIKNLIAFVNMSEQELESIAQKPFNLDNAQLVLDLSESMLEGSQYIVDSLKANAKVSGSDVLATSGKQRMLAQRIAKYYIAYQSGIKDKNTVDQMKTTVKLFDENNKKLINYPGNSSVISNKLKKINMLWKIVYKFYLNIEKGGLPFIVFTSTDDITDKMDQITELYARQ